jgi:hypothetical protein
MTDKDSENSLMESLILPEPEVVPKPEVEAFEEPDVLTRQQVNQSLLDIEAIHPLRSLAKLEHIIPFFKLFIRRKPDFKFSLRKTLLMEMKIKLPKGEAQMQNDPFLILGYGVNAYF